MSNYDAQCLVFTLLAPCAHGLRASPMVGTLQGVPNLTHNSKYYFLYTHSSKLFLALFFQNTLQWLALQDANFINREIIFYVLLGPQIYILCIIGTTNEVGTQLYELPTFGTQSQLTWHFNSTSTSPMRDFNSTSTSPMRVPTRVPIHVMPHGISTPFGNSHWRCSYITLAIYFF